MTQKDDLAMDFSEILSEDLRDDEFCAMYLNTILEDYDSRLMLTAIKDIAKARGLKIEDLAKKAGLSRRVVYHALSPQGNPSLNTLLPLLKAFGLRLRFEMVVAETA